MGARESTPKKKREQIQCLIERKLVAHRSERLSLRECRILYKRYVKGIRRLDTTPKMTNYVLTEPIAHLQTLGLFDGKTLVALQFQGDTALYIVFENDQYTGPAVSSRLLRSFYEEANEMYLHYSVRITTLNEKTPPDSIRFVIDTALVIKD